MTRKDITILAPAGSWESLVAAIDAGADAVYFGVGGLNMRAASSANFSVEDLTRIVGTAHGRGVKCFLTLNTVIYDEEMALLDDILDRAVAEGVDAVIASDLAVILRARERGLAVHISTQANVSNADAAEFYARWADTVVLARELNLSQVEAIAARNIASPDGQPIRIEMFAHGALCMAVSGRCYLSLHQSGNSANRGACRQLCRRDWELRDRETGEALVVEDRWLLSPKDLCTLPFLDRMLAAGVRVLKIEGRARSAEYVRRTVEVYGEAVEAVCDGSFDARRVEVWQSRVAEVFNRGFWSGWYLGAEVPELSRNYGSSATKRKVYVGRVTNFFKKISVAEVLVEASELDSGSELLVLGETTGAIEMADVAVRVGDGFVDVAPQGVYCSIKTDTLLRRGDKVYKIINC